MEWKLVTEAKVRVASRLLNGCIDICIKYQAMQRKVQRKVHRKFHGIGMARDMERITPLNNFKSGLRLKTSARSSFLSDTVPS